MVSIITGPFMIFRFLISELLLCIKWSSNHRKLLIYDGFKCRPKICWAVLWFGHLRCYVSLMVWIEYQFKTVFVWCFNRKYVGFEKPWRNLVKWRRLFKFSVLDMESSLILAHSDWHFRKATTKAFPNIIGTISCYRKGKERDLTSEREFFSDEFSMIPRASTDDGKLLYYV